MIPNPQQSHTTNQGRFDGELKSVTCLLKILQKPDLGQRVKRNHVWYRGQSDYAWQLKPGVYRDEFGVKGEEERLTRERLMVQDFRVMAAGLLPSHASESEIYFLLQHYGMPTRLLDWTNNPLASLYFTVRDHPDRVGAFFLMDAHSLASRQEGKTYDGKEFKGVATSRNSTFATALHPIFRWVEQGFPNFIMPVRPDYSDPRITLQRACFTFHPPDRGQLEKQHDDILESYTIPTESKITIQQELSSLDVDAFSIYGDLDHLSHHLKKTYEVS
jgi:hypothetical protein